MGSRKKMSTGEEGEGEEVCGLMEKRGRMVVWWPWYDEDGRMITNVYHAAGFFAVERTRVSEDRFVVFVCSGEEESVVREYVPVEARAVVRVLSDNKMEEVRGLCVGEQEYVIVVGDVREFDAGFVRNVMWPCVCSLSDDVNLLVFKHESSYTIANPVPVPEWENRGGAEWYKKIVYTGGGGASSEC